MQTLTFTCRVITPMFLAGADGSTPELRAASIKGAMRFWWRALNGHLSLGDLRKQETEIFGGVGTGDEGGSRSSFSLRVNGSVDLDKDVVQEKSVPHKQYKSASIKIGKKYDVILTVSDNYHIANFDTNKLIALFQLTCILGGLGRRSRRGMGSVVIEKIEHKTRNEKKDITPCEPSKLASVKTLLDILAPARFEHDTAKNTLVSSGFKGDYPWVKMIELGNFPATHKSIVEKISTNSHLTKESCMNMEEWSRYNKLERNKEFNSDDFKKLKEKIKKYEYEIGFARANARFASPVYFSCNESSVLITTLNCVPTSSYIWKSDHTFDYQQKLKLGFLKFE